MKRLMQILVPVLGVLGLQVLWGDESAMVFVDDFSEPVTNWQTWSPRDEIAPVFGWDDQVGRNSSGSLRIASAGNAASYGAWKILIPKIKPNANYCFEAWYRTEGIKNDMRSVIPRLHWKTAEGAQARPPEFIAAKEKVNGWNLVKYTVPAPSKATQIEIHLGFGFSAKGKVWWDDVRLTEMPKPKLRTVRVATMHHQPQGTRTAEESVSQFVDLVERTAKLDPDIVCLPEGITVVGNPLNYIDVSESVPGPTTKLLGKLAAKHDCYIVAGIYERVEELVYNTAVLIDRNGKLTGTYRKTHLPREEWEGGISPGDSYPVFDTDFGKIGLMICWDVQFPEPARAMALQGAELLLLPIWGGNEILARARAIENHVFLVSSSYGMRSFVVDPTGKVVTEAKKDDPIAVAEIQLDQPFFQPWLGNMKHRTWKERRPDIPVE